jgi:hypothetical protein
VADPHRFDADPDPAYHFDANPELYPNPTVRFVANPYPHTDPSFQIKAQNLEKVIYLGSYSYSLACHLQIVVDPDPHPAYHFDADPDPTFHFDEDPSGSGSRTLPSTHRVPYFIMFCQAAFSLVYFTLHLVQVDLTNKNVSIAVVGKDKDFTMYDDADVDQFLSGIEGEERRRGQR